MIKDTPKLKKEDILKKYYEKSLGMLKMNETTLALLINQFTRFKVSS